MGICGIGNDIIEIERIKEAVERSNRFLEKVFTAKEIEYASKSKTPYNIYAGRFAAKEAVSKAFGTGIRGFNLTDIEIVNDDQGKPGVFLYGSLTDKYQGHELMVTISHNKTAAIATAILIKS